MLAETKNVKYTNSLSPYLTEDMACGGDPDANYTEDIDNQAAGNYDYDNIGNLIKDTKEGITGIEWTVYGKIKQINKGAVTIKYAYDPGGNRVRKEVTGAPATNTNQFYIRDAAGNTLAIYDVRHDDAEWAEQHLYGASRLGMWSYGKATPTAPGAVVYDSMMVGSVSYELSNHLGNVLSTISDKKVGISAGKVTVDYYSAEVLGQNDYYSFGMGMPGRKFNGVSLSGVEGYRYGFNTQEHSAELNDNLYTAKYWEYDTRISRRWNLDPIYNTDISRYAVNGNNPNYFLDPDGDFRTKLGARWYKFWHGTKGNIGQNTTEGSNRNGQWYIQRESETGRKGDGKEKLDEVIVYAPIYGDQKNTKQGAGDPWHQNPLPDIDKIVDKAADNVNRTAKYIKQNASDIWNSPMARAIVPDYYTVSFSFQTSSIFYTQEEGTFTFLLRGKDPGLYFTSTTGGGLVTAMGVDVGASVGKGYFLTLDPRKFDSKTLGGWQTSGGAGLGVSMGPSGSINGVADVGFNEYGRPTTVTGRVGIFFGLDYPTILKVPISAGGGKTTDVKKLIGF